LYLDASAITKLVVAEPESHALEALVLDRQVFSSRVAQVEVTKAARRHTPDADMTAVFARLSWVELDEGIADTAGMAGGAMLRTLDAIHVASALRVTAGIEAFVTYDARQAAAAESAGLTVLAPAEVP
jgi:predicted nucleic acid-binding protein